MQLRLALIPISPLYYPLCGCSIHPNARPTWHIQSRSHIQTLPDTNPRPMTLISLIWRLRLVHPTRFCRDLQMNPYSGFDLSESGDSQFCDSSLVGTSPIYPGQDANRVTVIRSLNSRFLAEALDDGKVHPCLSFAPSLCFPIALPDVNSRPHALTPQFVTALFLPKT